MKRMAGIIFSNVYDSEFGELSSHRTVASLSFGGRYRLIDFVLSSMVNSGITSVGVITKYNYESLMAHLGSCEEWDLNRKNGGLTIIPPYAFGTAGVYQGKLEALYNALDFLKSLKDEYVLISDTVNVCNIDFASALKNHVESGKDITAIVSELDEDTAKNKAIFNLQQDNVSEIFVNCKGKKGEISGLGMYIMQRELLISTVESCVSAGFYHFEKDFLQKRFNEGTLSVNIYKFDGVVLRNRSIQSFLENNLKLVNEDVRNGIFIQNSPIYTKVRDEIPTYYGENSVVNDCVIADGCLIEGKIENSAIFRNVKIEEGATVVGSVVMSGTKIGKGAYIENVIIDRDVTISEGKRIIGLKEAPVVIKKGETV